MRTWGRDDVLVQVYAKLVAALSAGAAARTVDQQNAVDRVTAVAKRRSAPAAMALPVSMSNGPVSIWVTSTRCSGLTRARLHPGLPVRHAHELQHDPASDATDGWCVYRSPAPYAGDYQGFNVPTCIGTVIGFVLPPTPTYDDFVKWGSAKANYPLLSSQAFQERATSLGIALSIASL